MDIDQPLDSFVKKSTKPRRTSGRLQNGRGGRRRTSGVGTARRQNATRAVTNAAATSTSTTAAAPAKKREQFPEQVGEGKIIISNLPLDVRENQVKDLFNETIGPVKTCNLQHNERGKSIGVAHVVFKSWVHAREAYNNYNGRIIDQSRPMKVELVFDPTKVPPPPLHERLAPKKNTPSGPASQRTTTANGAGRRTGTTVGARRGRGGRGGRVTRKRREPKKSAEQLDMEMDSWAKEGQPPAAAPATTTATST